MPSFRPSTTHELSRLLDDARLGFDDAAATIHQEFVDKLIRLANRRINQRFRSKIGPDEVVQSVFASFFRRNRNGEFECDGWDDLRVLLIKITVHKCINKTKTFATAKRDVTLEHFDPGDWSSFFGADDQPTVEELAIFNESLDELFDRLSPQLQQIVTYRLRGMSNFEISEMISCSERTVYRSLNRIREIFLEMKDF